MANFIDSNCNVASFPGSSPMRAATNLQAKSTLRGQPQHSSGLRDLVGDDVYAIGFTLNLSRRKLVDDLVLTRPRRVVGQLGTTNFNWLAKLLYAQTLAT